MEETNVILEKINLEYELGNQFMQNKRETFAKRFKKYHNISDTENKYYSRMIKTIVTQAQAMHSKKDVEVDFFAS
jgi:hypothetical protein